MTLEVACLPTHDPMTITPTGAKAGSGTAEPSHDTDTDQKLAPPSLTASSVRRAGRLIEDQVVARFRQGRVSPFSLLPWESSSRLTESGLRSSHRWGPRRRLAEAWLRPIPCKVVSRRDGIALAPQDPQRNRGLGPRTSASRRTPAGTAV